MPVKRRVIKSRRDLPAPFSELAAGVPFAQIEFSQEAHGRLVAEVYFDRNDWPELPPEAARRVAGLLACWRGR